MADQPIDERRFSDEEVREILAKAVERAPSRAAMGSEGMSLAELTTIAEEVGIDPARVEDAARSVTVSGRNRPSAFLGGATQLEFERRAAGAVSPDDMPEIISLIRRITGLRGEVREVHGSFEWSDAGGAGERLVTLSTRDGVTTIRASANMTPAAIITYLPAGMIGAIVSLIGLMRFVKSGSELALIVFFTVLPLLYPILRSIYGRVSGAEEDKLARVVDELARRIEAPGEVTSEARSPPRSGA